MFNLDCLALCSSGCICPAGAVYDPVFGCKDAALCGPPPAADAGCCEAMTSTCLACQAGVPESLYCNVNPETEGCVPPAPGCTTIECGPVRRGRERALRWGEGTRCC